MTTLQIRTAEDFEDLLVEALTWQDAAAWETIEDGVREARSFRDAGLLTSDHGIEIRLSNGATFQLTIVRSERPADPGFECPECGAEFDAAPVFVDHLVDEHRWDAEDAMDQIEEASR